MHNQNTSSVAIFDRNLWIKNISVRHLVSISVRQKKQQIIWEAGNLKKNNISNKIFFFQYSEPYSANALDFSRSLRNFDPFTGQLEQLLDSPEFPNFTGKCLSWILKIQKG
jgi:hypothetical protein